MAKADPSARWYQDQLARGKAQRAARALAEGRTPGQSGTPHRRRADAINRDPERRRAYNREYMRKWERARRGWPQGLLDAPAGTYYHRMGPRARPQRPRPPEEPLPAWYTGHELYEAARALLRPHELQELAAGDMDSAVPDLVGAYVLAALEGYNPEEALVAARRRRSRDRAVLVHGLARVDDLVR